MNAKSKELDNQIKTMIFEIVYNLQRLYDTTCFNTKYLLFNEILCQLENLQKFCCTVYVHDQVAHNHVQRKLEDNTMIRDQKVFTADELRQYDGRQGSPAYVAVNGIVYDISHIPQWAQGVHFGISAGQDVSERVYLCHGGYVLDLLKVVGRLIPGSQRQERTEPAEKSFTLEELAKYDGKNGQPAYVAVNGIVYDVTNSATWAGASHFGLRAGADASEEFTSCHMNEEALKKLKVVGRLV